MLMQTADEAGPSVLRDSPVGALSVNGLTEDHSAMQSPSTGPSKSRTPESGSRSPSNTLAAEASTSQVYKESDTNTTICSNCGTSTTPLWRRSENGSILCNACSLHLKKKGFARPVSLKTDVIKHRNRSKGKGKDKKASHTLASNQDALASSRGSNGRPGSLERRKSDSDVDMSSDERSEAFDRNSGKRQKRDDQPEAPNAQAQMDYLAAIASHQHQRNIQQGNPWTAPYAQAPVPSGRRSPTAQPGSRSTSLDARADHLQSLANRGTLAGRSPSQPAYPHSHQPLYPSGLQHSHSPYANYYPHPGSKDQKQTFPIDSAARYSPNQEQQNGDRKLVLPSLSSLTQHLREDEGPYQSDLARGRQRDRIVLPPIQAMPDHQQHPSFPPAQQQAQRPSPSHMFEQHRSNDASPQIPDRPGSSSSISSGSNNATGQSPFSQHSVLPNIAHSPALLPVAEHPDAQPPVSSERRGRSVTRKPAMGDAQMLDHSLEAVRIASRSNSRSNSPSPAWHHDPAYGGPQNRQQNYPHFRSSSARGRPVEQFSNVRGSAREDSILGKHGRSSSERAAPNEDVDDVDKLRTRIAELELINSLLTSRVKQLEGNASKPQLPPGPKENAEMMYEA